MRLYVELARREAQRHLAYRMATVAGLFTNAVFGIIFSTVFLALYEDRRQNEAVAGFTLTDTLTYVWLAQAMLMVIAVWGTWDIAQGVRSGDIVADLSKPFNFFFYWLSRDLGRAACQALVRFVPTLAIGALLYDLGLSTDPVRWGLFTLSLTLATLVSFAIRFSLNLVAFWTIDIQGVRYLQLSVINLLSGLLIPLAFFPGPLRAVAEVLPFRAMVMTPVDIALGRGAAVPALALQAGWAMVMGGVAMATLGLATRKLVVQGG
ncbi:MAG: ABC-2 family transporter protein [Thermomicrobiales bacterium]